MKLDLTVRDLAVFGAAGRGDWDPDDLTGAITAARSSGWEWTRILPYLAQLMADDDAAPRDLREACRNPVERRQPAAPPSDEYRKAFAKLTGGTQ